ncbi:MAG: glycosyltransferase family 4 protein, partial [Minisyncoccia bacterium]
MKILYLYMFPLWGNGSGAWLRQLTFHLKQKYSNEFDAAIVAPEARRLKYVKIYKLKPPKMGVFVGNPELPQAEKYTKFSNIDLIEIINYYLIRIAKLVKKYKPDLIHVFHTAFLPHIGRVISDFFKIPFIITTHGSDLYYLQEDPRLRKLVRDSSVRAKYITANSNFTREWYLQMFGRDLSKKTKTIPAGISPNPEKSENNLWIDKKYHFQYNKMVLFTGRLTQHKGVEYLIKAARKI